MKKIIIIWTIMLAISLPLTVFASLEDQQFMIIKGLDITKIWINILNGSSLWNQTDTSLYPHDATANLKIPSITGSTQCLQVDTNGVVSGFGSACGGTGEDSTQYWQTTNGTSLFHLLYSQTGFGCPNMTSCYANLDTDSTDDYATSDFQTDYNSQAYYTDANASDLPFSNFQLANQTYSQESDLTTALDDNYDPINSNPSNSTITIPHSQVSDFEAGVIQYEQNPTNATIDAAVKYPNLDTDKTDDLDLPALDNNTVIRSGLNESWGEMGNVTDNSQIANSAGYITSYTDTDTRAKADNIYLYNDSDTIYFNETAVGNEFNQTFTGDENITITKSGNTHTFHFITSILLTYLKTLFYDEESDLTGLLDDNYDPINSNPSNSTITIPHSQVSDFEAGVIQYEQNPTNATIDAAVKYPNLDTDKTDDLDLPALDNNTVIRTANTTWRDEANIGEEQITIDTDWDIGAYFLQALRFISDVAHGTAPFIVTSKTQVANLNASYSGLAYDLECADCIQDSHIDWAGLTDLAAGGVLSGDCVDESHIADNGIDSEHYNDGSIDDVHLAVDYVMASELNNTDRKIRNLTVTHTNTTMGTALTYEINSSCTCWGRSTATGHCDCS